MFSLSEVQTPAELQAFSMFRAWWDVVLEYLVAASALNILILMSRLSSVDTGGVVCVHPDKNVAFGFVESRYVNSRCCRGSSAWILIFYPYVLFFEWMLITASLVCWIKLPSVFTKLDTFYDILSKIFTVQPKSYRTSNTLRVAHQLAYDEKNEKAIDVLLNRLLYLMTERPFLRRSYLLRYAFVIILCFISVSSAIVVLALLKTFPSTFLCFLEHKPPTLRGYPSETDRRGIYCHLNIGPFIYFQIVVDCVLRLIMIAFSTYGFYWALRETGSVGSTRFNRRHLRFGSPSFNRNRFSKREQSPTNMQSSCRLNAEADQANENMASSIPHDEDILGQAKEFISGLPGYPDLIFCIQLLRKNTHDGHLMHDSVCSCIRRYVERFQVANKPTTEHHNFPSTDSLQIGCMKQKAIKESVVYVRWICNYLGFYEVPNAMDSGHLFECIEFIKDSLSIIDLNVSKSLREQIVDEIQSHPELYKTLIDDDPNFPDYETHCSRLRSSDIYGSHYVLLAASTLFNVRLVIIHCEPVTQLPEVYLPMRSQLIKIEDSDVNGNSHYHHHNSNSTQTGYGQMSSAVTMSMQRRAHGIDPFINPDEYSNSTDLNTRFLTYVSPHFYHATENLPINREWAAIVTRRTRYANFLSYRRDVRSTAVRSVVSTHDYDPLVDSQDSEIITT